MPEKIKRYKKLKRFLIVIAVLIISFIAYVQIVNRNSVNMTNRQKFLKAVYPMWMWFTKLTGKNSEKLAATNKTPAIDFYSLKDTLNNGAAFNFTQLRGKKVLLVNTASNCGYTNQYDDLQKLHEQFGDSLTILGFPANDFKEQEKGSDDEIAQFCKLNFGVTFTLMKKSSVVKSSGQNPVFKWLSDATQNGWNEKQPTWNFSKYLVNEKGELVNYFDPSVSPLSDEVVAAIKNK
jgi:glutathione peroxidase